MSNTSNTLAKLTGNPGPEEAAVIENKNGKPRRNGYVLKAIRLVPSLLVIAGLIGLAWYGHHNDWKLPSLQASATISDKANPEWCKSHSVPETECINCNPELLEAPPKLEFCNEHGVHGCLLHHPNLAQTKKPIEVRETDFQRVAHALSIRPRRENLSLSQLPGTRIQFASIKAIERAGIDVEPVEKRHLTETISAAGEIRYDATRTAQVSPSVDGIVRLVTVNVGDWVQKGQVMAYVDSEKVGRLKSELLAALSNEHLKQTTVSRIAPLARTNTVPGKRLVETEAELQQASVAVDLASRALENLGLSFDMGQLRQLSLPQATTAVRQLGQSKLAGISHGDNWIAVLAPLEGRIVYRKTVVGEVVDRGSEMFRISDTRNVWLDLRLPAEEAPLAKLGQEIRFRPDGQTTEHIGKVIWISSDVDPQTRTVRVRAALANKQGNLRNEAFGVGEIVLRDEPNAMVVPDSSIQWDGQNTLLFVRDAKFFDKERPKFFTARSVRTGVSQNGFTEIIVGVFPGEVVASEGCDLLRSQLLRGNLGAGCTCGK